MKCVLLKHIAEYNNSDSCLYEEFSGQLLMISIKFVTYGKDFIKVIIIYFIYFFKKYIYK